jgi:L-amino acid N-acyltransferase YncA
MNKPARNTTQNFVIEPATDGDLPAIKALFLQIVDEGETYSYARDHLSDDWMRDYWLTHTTVTLVARAEGEVAGVVAIRVNRQGRGNHVANASYIVDPRFRGRGIGRALGEASIEAAREKGFKAIQFNFVVSTNTHAVTLWQSLGFEIVGTLPQAFRHAHHGFVDVYIMHRFL